MEKIFAIGQQLDPQSIFRAVGCGNFAVKRRALPNHRLTPAQIAQLSPGERAKWYRRNELAPPAVAGAIEPPAWLSARHKALFHETVAAAPPGLLQPIDRGLVAAYCMQLDVLAEASAESGAQAQRLARQTAGSLAQLANALCLTPVLRARLALDTPPPKPVEAEPDRWAELRHSPVIHRDKR
jgi:phage terminase small subunit